MAASWTHPQVGPYSLPGMHPAKATSEVADNWGLCRFPEPMDSQPSLVGFCPLGTVPEMVITGAPGSRLQKGVTTNSYPMWPTSELRKEPEWALHQGSPYSSRATVMEVACCIWLHLWVPVSQEQCSETPGSYIRVLGQPLT